MALEQLGRAVCNGLRLDWLTFGEAAATGRAPEGGRAFRGSPSRVAGPAQVARRASSGRSARPDAPGWSPERSARPDVRRPAGAAGASSWLTPARFGIAEFAHPLSFCQRAAGARRRPVRAGPV